MAIAVVVVVIVVAVIAAVTVVATVVATVEVVVVAVVATVEIAVVVVAATVEIVEIVVVAVVKTDPVQLPMARLENSVPSVVAIAEEMRKILKPNITGKTEEMALVEEIVVIAKVATVVPLVEMMLRTVTPLQPLPTIKKKRRGPLAVSVNNLSQLWRKRKLASLLTTTLHKSKLLPRA